MSWQIRPSVCLSSASAAESVLPSSTCAAIYGVMSHVYISNTPSSTNVIVELDGLLRASTLLRDLTFLEYFCTIL